MVAASHGPDHSSAPLYEQLLHAWWWLNRSAGLLGGPGWHNARQTLDALYRSFCGKLDESPTGPASLALRYAIIQHAQEDSPSMPPLLDYREGPAGGSWT